MREEGQETCERMGKTHKGGREGQATSERVRKDIHEEGARNMCECEERHT